VLLDGISSTDTTEVVLHDSYHVATLDHDAPEIFAGSVDWIRAHTSARRPAESPAAEAT
jgi:carboxylesterase